MFIDQSALQIFLAKDPVPGSPALVSAFEELAKNLLENATVPQFLVVGQDVFSSLDQIRQNQACAVQVIEGVFEAFNGNSQLPPETQRLCSGALGQTLAAALIAKGNDPDFFKKARAMSRRVVGNPFD